MILEQAVTDTAPNTFVALSPHMVWGIVTAMVVGPAGTVLGIVRWMQARLDKADKERAAFYSSLLKERELVAERRDVAITAMLDRFQRFEEQECEAHAAIVSAMQDIGREISKSSMSQERVALRLDVLTEAVNDVECAKARHAGRKITGQ